MFAVVGSLIFDPAVTSEEQFGLSDGLAEAYSTGQGVEQSDERAAAWYRKAATQGHVESQAGLGRVSAKPEDLALVTHAAAQAALAAQFRLDGDATQAVRYFRMSAEQGHLSAMYNLGYHYADGLGVAQDDEKAYVWFSIAVLSGYRMAASSRDDIEKRLTPEQLSDAKRRVKEWDAVHPR